MIGKVIGGGGTIGGGGNRGKYSGEGVTLRNSLDPKITDYTPIAIISRINGLQYYSIIYIYW